VRKVVAPPLFDASSNERTIDMHGVRLRGQRHQRVLIKVAMHAGVRGAAALAGKVRVHDALRESELVVLGAEELRGRAQEARLERSVVAQRDPPRVREAQRAAALRVGQHRRCLDDAVRQRRRQQLAQEDRAVRAPRRALGRGKDLAWAWLAGWGLRSMVAEAGAL
jgi:hypothetical protein